MGFMNSIIWLATSAICAVIAAAIVLTVMGGEFGLLMIAGFLGGIAGIYIFEFAGVELALGNEYVDQAVVAMVGSLAFAFIAAFVGGDVIGFE